MENALLSSNENIQAPLLNLNGNQDSDQHLPHIVSRNRFVLVSCCAIMALATAIAIPVFVSGFIEAGIRGDVVIDSETADGFQQFVNTSKDGTLKGVLMTTYVNLTNGSLFLGDNYLEFYFFNITNPYEILQGAKPIVQELGPWIYTTHQIRSDFEWNKTADTLAYREDSWFTFDPIRTKQRSNFSDDSLQVTTLNLLFQGMEAQVGTAYFHMICDQLLWKTDYHRLFSQKSVHEYITGYKEIIHIGGIKIPIAFPGIYPNKTRETNPSYQIKTIMRVGEQDIDQVYDIISWHGMNHVEIKCPWGANPLPMGRYCPGNFPCCQNHSLVHHHDNLVPVWGTEEFPDEWDSDANLVHGRNGEQFQPGLHSESTLIVFNDIVNRALKFVCNNDEKIHHKGVEVLRFTPDRTTFMNATERPANARYYQFGPFGFLGNLSILEMGADLHASLPHFLYGDPRLVEDVEGLSPDPVKHRMTIDIEPNLGQTFFENVRAQISGRLKRGERWGFKKWFPKVRDGVFVPIGWFNMVSTIRDGAVKEFDELLLAQGIRRGCIIGGSIASIFLIAYWSVLCIRIRKRQAYHETHPHHHHHHHHNIRHHETHQISSI